MEIAEWGRRRGGRRWGIIEAWVLSLWVGGGKRFGCVFDDGFDRRRVDCCRGIFLWGLSGWIGKRWKKEFIS